MVPQIQTAIEEDQVPFLHTQMVQLQCIESAEKIASNFMCNLIAIKTAVDIYLIDKSLTLTVLLCSQIADLLLKPFREEKQGSGKKLTLFFAVYCGNGKILYLSVILAYVDIGGNKLADFLANETRIIKPIPLSAWLFMPMQSESRSFVQILG